MPLFSTPATSFPSSLRFSLACLAALLLASVTFVGCAPSGSEEPPVAPEANAREEVLAASEEPPDGPFLVALGTAQDGGLPHASCDCSRCSAARRDPARRRLVASLGLVLSAGGERYLFDATPDLEEQLHRLAAHRPGPPRGRVDRDPLAGVFLTHAHIGHYLGLAQFGFEVVHTQGLPVHATPRLAALLRDDAPWSQLVAIGNMELREMAPGATVVLGEAGEGAAERVTVTSLPVPHRDELSDTVAYRIEGPERTVLYVPDTDGWDSWAPSLEASLEGVDVALLDGTFFSLDELPGRAISSIGHPLIVETLERLASRVASGELELVFTHLNHSNPAVEPGSAALATIREGGARVLGEGERIPL